MAADVQVLYACNVCFKPEGERGPGWVLEKADDGYEHAKPCPRCSKDLRARWEIDKGHHLNTASRCWDPERKAWLCEKCAKAVGAKNYIPSDLSGPDEPPSTYDPKRGW